MSKKLQDWFLESFMRGFTIFHLTGIILMVLGDSIGERQNTAGVLYTLLQVAGFLTFFWEIMKTISKTAGEYLGAMFSRKS